MSLLHLFSLILEISVALLGIQLATAKHKQYGWYIALTFGIYVFYDLMRFLGKAEALGELLDILFVIASLSILTAVWQIYKKK